MTIIAGTGHRPRSLGGYSEAAWRKLWSFAVQELRRVEPEKVITGMALGWDQALARACVRLKIPFVVAVPFDGQSTVWPKDAQRRYAALLGQATQVVMVSPGGYDVSKLHKRNEWMVDNCDELLALYNGADTGGTAACVRYAQEVGRPIDNCWERWAAL